MIYVGTSTKLSYNHDKGVWVMMQHKFGSEPKTLATVKASLTNMALGENIWTVYNDTKECNTNDGETYESATPIARRSAAIVRSRIIASTPFISRERDTSIRAQPDHPGPSTRVSACTDPVVDNSPP